MNPDQDHERVADEPDEDDDSLTYLVPSTIQTTCQSCGDTRTFSHHRDPDPTTAHYLCDARGCEHHVVLDLTP